MKRIVRSVIVGTTAAVMMAAGACSAATTAKRPNATNLQNSHSTVKQYGRIYYANGHCYTRTYNDDSTLIWYILFLNNASQPARYTNVAQVQTASFTNIRWQSVTTTPPSPVATTKVVSAAEDGEPSEAVEEQSEVPDDSTITSDDTTDEQAQGDTDNDNTDSGTDSGDDGSDGGGGGSGDSN